MQTPWCSLFLLVGMTLTPARSGVAQLTLRGGLVYDGDGFVARDLHIVDGVFAPSPAADARELDVSGQYLIPPFADAHSHRYAGAYDAAEATAMFLRAGVFYVANLCGPGDSRAVTEAFNNQPRLPDVLFACGALTCPGGHPVGLYRRLHAMRQQPDSTFLADNEDNTFYEVADAAELAAKWPLLMAHRPDLVKIILARSTAHLGETTPEAAADGLHPELVPDVVRRARTRGLRVVAHVEDADDAHLAATAGCAALVHMPGYNFKLPPDAERTARFSIRPQTAALLAERGIAVIPTVGLSADTRSVRAFQGKNLATLREAGVTIAFGSDRWLDIEAEWDAMLRTGAFTLTELIHIRCVVTPRFLYPERAIGALDVGCEASLLALESNPLEDRRAVERIALRIKQGVELAAP